MIALAARAQTIDSGMHKRQRRHSALLACCVIVAMAYCGIGTVRADTRLNAHYAITMMGVSIGQITWTIDLGASNYSASADGKASGALSILVSGEGRVATRGTVNGARINPTFFSSNTTEDDKIAGLQMTFENGAVKTLRTDEPLRNSDRIPVGEADRQGVTDPLSAMLIAVPAGGHALAAASCDRVLAVFDGQRRYNLILTFKRMDSVKIERGYAGPVLVCAVTLQPIAGYRADSLLVKYVGGRRDMEIWFAPIIGSSVAAPARLVMPTLIGTLEIAANRFEIVAPKPAPTAPSEPIR